MAVTPFGNLPLQTGTFLSRISRFMSSGVNYVATGFKPGYALQAAELNEIHEQHLFYQTLSNRASYNWKSYDLNSIPFWDGATPYSISNLTASVVGSQITVTLNAGWYYLIDTTSQNANNSGIGFWVNTLTPTTIIISPSDIPAAIGGTVRYGFRYSISTVNVSQDAILKDESNSLIAGITVPGADRIKIDNLTIAKHSTGFTKFSEVFAAKKISSTTYSIFWPYSNYSKQIAATTPL